MITNDQTLSPFAKNIVMEIAFKDNSDDFMRLVKSYKYHADLIYEKYILLQNEIKKAKLAEFEKDVVLTHGDEILLNLLERAAFRFMSDGVSLQDFCTTYSNFYERLYRLPTESSQKTEDNKGA